MKARNHTERAVPAGALASRSSRQLMHTDESHALHHAIVDTVREPLLVLDKDLRVVTANRSFYQTFEMTRQDVQGRPVYALGNGQWNVPELRTLLENIAPQHAIMEAYEVAQDFPGMGRRTMLLNARKVFYEEDSHTTILLGIEDITERRFKERALDQLLQHKEILLREMQHRVGNSLQIIASILLIKARTVRSEETRQHLEEAHQRIVSIAAVQQQLQAADSDATIDLDSYLSRLCETLAASMITDRRPISITAHVDGGTASSSEAVSMGLIVTELVINALKHAFPAERKGAVVVTYDPGEPNWKLTVSDNGIGRPEGHLDKTNPGLGTTIIETLARQLDARVEVLMDPHGTAVSIIHTSSAVRSASAAQTPTMWSM